MNISVDAGGVCDVNSRFGNYVFSSNLIRALKQYDKKNTYHLYSFCNYPRSIRTQANLKKHILLPKPFWMSVRVGTEEYLRPKDIFLALNQAKPIFIKAPVISFSHGLSFFYYPQLYKSQYSRLFGQICTMMKKSFRIVVSSERVKQEFLKEFPDVKNIHAIPFGIPSDMIRTTNGNGRKALFLFVGMNHPIKNINFLLNAFEVFRKNPKYSDYKLCLVGPFKHLQSEKNHIFCKSAITRSQLRSLYRRATAYLTASKYESFNLPVLEALSQGCQVVGLSSAIIPEFNQYVFAIDDKQSFIKAMGQVADGRRKNIEYRRLNKEFSWENYVKELTKLYSV